MQRVHCAAFHRAASGRERLPEHLAAEHLRAADVAARAAKKVHFEPLEFEQPDKVGEQAIHVCRAVSRYSVTPSRFCMIGLVVVYWR